MPSRAETRVSVEHGLRAVVISALAVILWQSLGERTDSQVSMATVRSGALGGVIREWSELAHAHSRINVQMHGVLSRIERAWLGALAGAGSSVSWIGELSPVMVDARPNASPTGGTRVLASAPSGSSVMVGDDVGVIDTVRARHGGMTLAFGYATNRVTASARGVAASTVQRDSMLLRKILVIGNAGWESKFVIAALEDEGWKLEGFVRVAPGVDINQGAAAEIDTSIYSAVIALDEAATPHANRILKFARMGGGVVLGSGAASLDFFASLRAGNADRAASAVRTPQEVESITLGTLSLAPITLRTDAIPLERRGGVVAIAARRIGAGRMLQFGYEDTWRWRMGGGEGAIRDHRLWWTEVVGRVAYAPQAPRTATGASTDEAPMIGLVAALGPDTPTGKLSSQSGTPSAWMPWLFALITLALIGEVASRRMQGAT